MSGHLDFQKSLLPMPPESPWHMAQALQDEARPGCCLPVTSQLPGTLSGRTSFALEL